MLVNAKSNGLLMLPYGDNSNKMVRLVPGWNEIPSNIWEKVESVALTAQEDGSLELQAKVIEEEGKTIYKEMVLGEVRINIARGIVEGCFNFETLEMWQNDAKLSTELRNLADIQLKKIETEGYNQK